MDEKNFRTQVAHSSRDVLEFYDRYAATWDERFGQRRSSEAFHRVRLESFLRIANLKATDRIIELGVGTGPYLDVLSTQVKEITCVDGSQKMLDQLLERHKRLRNTKLLQMDLEQPIEGQLDQADLVYCFGLIEHIIRPEVLIENCRKMLRPGGRVVFISPNGRSPWYGWMRYLWRGGKHCSTDRYYTKEELDGLMFHQGFMPERAVYWGYFPAGVGDGVYWVLNGIGRIIDRTWMRRYAGGLSVSYVMKH